MCGDYFVLANHTMALLNYIILCNLVNSGCDGYFSKFSLAAVYFKMDIKQRACLQYERNFIR